MTTARRLSDPLAGSINSPLDSSVELTPRAGSASVGGSSRFVTAGAQAVAVSRRRTSRDANGSPTKQRLDVSERPPRALRSTDIGSWFLAFWFSPDGHTFAAGAKEIYLYDTQIGQQTLACKRTSLVYASSCSPDGVLFCVGDEEGHLVVYYLGPPARKDGESPPKLWEKSKTTTNPPVACDLRLRFLRDSSRSQSSSRASPTRCSARTGSGSLRSRATARRPSTVRFSSTFSHFVSRFFLTHFFLNLRTFFLIFFSLFSSLSHFFCATDAIDGKVPARTLSRKGVSTQAVCRGVFQILRLFCLSKIAAVLLGPVPRQRHGARRVFHQLLQQRRRPGRLKG